MCYEIFTFGSVPYAALTNMEMLEFIQAGNRLELPKHCPESVYNVMVKCWKELSEDRPTFKEIGEIFRQLLEKETSNYGYLTLNNISDKD